MTGHICIIFTTTILGVHIFHYYLSNSITSNPTVFTGVITSMCRQTNTCACLVTLAIDVVETATTCSCAVFCALFLASFLNFRCLNITTFFNIDVKICFHAVATASCSTAILRRCCGHLSSSTRVQGISVYIFSCNCTVSARNYGTVQF